MNELETTAGLAETPGYRYADRVGDQLFIAGQVPLDPSGALVGGGIAAQAEACLGNLRVLIEVHGFGLDDVRHLTIHVVGEVESLGTAWGAVRAWFSGEVPPATLLGARSLGYPGQLVEVDAVIARSR